MHVPLLRKAVVPSAQCIGGNFEYPDDNAHLYRVRVAIEFLRQQGVEHVLQWPDKSSNMSPIKHIVDALGV